MAKNRPNIPPKSKKILQKEINSVCPFCENEEVQYFEIHHLDDNPSNNNLNNLLMLCRICHSKITKKDISENEVRVVKENLKYAKQKIELASVTVDTQSSWEQKTDNKHAFYFSRDENLNPFLVLNWSFINHLPKTVILTKLIYDAYMLPSGISGIPEPSLLESLKTYKIQIQWDGPAHVWLLPQIQVPEKQAFQFGTELFYYGMNKQPFPLSRDRLYIDFTFEFSDRQIVKAPRIFLNCKSKDEKMVIRILM